MMYSAGAFCFILFRFFIFTVVGIKLRASSVLLGKYCTSELHPSSPFPFTSYIFSITLCSW
jgi:hypothetical protein